MSNTPGELKFTNDHEWLRIEDDGSVVLGITEHAQEALGDLVYVELPEAEQELDAGDGLAVVESVKAASDVYAPCNCTVVEGNEALADQPELINSDPYGEGWIAKITLADRADLDALMDANAYDEFLLESDDH
ncbi:MAG: glycine cleavage system protein GcvH [Pseudomonadota bacterium]